MRHRSVKAVLLCLTVVAVMAACAAPAFAITWGGLDQSPAHPNVGMIVIGYWEDGEYVTEPLASGTLIAPKVFLTAGHVWDYIASYGIEDFWVTFTPEFKAYDYAHWLKGAMTPHPDYRWGAFDKCDLAVVVVEKAQRMTPARLPSLGLLDRMAAAGTLKGQTFTCVGYGLQERLHAQPGAPAFSGGGTRMKAVSTFSALTKPWLHTSQNQALGDGGTCYGDSGGPYFLGDSRTIVAVTSWGDAVCVSHSISYRLDTRSARSFLGDYVTLP